MKAACLNPDHPGHVECRAPAELSVEQISELARRTAAACSEAGYPVEVFYKNLFDLRNPRFEPSPPPEVFCKARGLAFASMGVEYEVVS